MSRCYFCVVPAQAWAKMLAEACNSPCRHREHDMALVFVSCRHGSKYFVLCRALDSPKKPCYDLSSNGMA